MPDRVLTVTHECPPDTMGWLTWRDHGAVSGIPLAIVHPGGTGRVAWTYELSLSCVASSAPDNVTVAPEASGLVPAILFLLLLTTTRKKPPCTQSPFSSR